jgi:hypothetical protein
MNKHTSIILGLKNPSEIFKYCNEHNISNLLEQKSEIWKKLIEKNYSNHVSSKCDFISYRDFYVLLYFMNALNLLNDLFVIEKSQELLTFINPIYEGDHIAIIHAANNISIRSNKAKVVMYRNKDSNCRIPTYGSGFLKIKYTSNLVNSYSNESENNDKEAFNVDLIHGGYKLF